MSGPYELCDVHMAPLPCGFCSARVNPMGQEPDEGTRLFPGSSAVERPCDTREAAGSMPALGTTSCDGPALGAER